MYWGKLGWFAILLVLGLTLSGCGSGDGTARETDEPTAEPRATATTAAPDGAGAATEAVETPAATPEETDIAPTPEPAEAVSCAAGLTSELRELDTRTGWPIYCPTHLPAGYERELIGGPDPLEIRIVNAATGSRIYFVQGVGLGLSAVTSRVRYEGEPVGPVPYGDIEGDLFRSLPDAPSGQFVAVLASPEGDGGGPAPLHYVEAYGMSEEEMRAVSAGMRRVDTIP